MRTNRYQNYFDDEILTAGPLELIQWLYRGALDAIASARCSLRQSEIRERSHAITKAMAIITELSVSLDHTSGGELSRNLAELYAYALRLLMQANADQSEAPLAEAERLLSTLFDAWRACSSSEDARTILSGAPSLQADPREPVSCAY